MKEKTKGFLKGVAVPFAIGVPAIVAALYFAPATNSTQARADCETAQKTMRSEAETPRERIPQREQKREKPLDLYDRADVQLLAKMLWGETRNCAEKERIAVGFTAPNRTEIGGWYGNTLRAAILKSKQYSCFNDGDPNKKLLENPARHDARAWEDCQAIAYLILTNQAADGARATHYFRPEVCSPKWRNDAGLEYIGKIQTERGLSRHVFMRDVRLPQKKPSGR
jgi:spore germination cell wall hydrolase CwlJ-like protein